MSYAVTILADSINQDVRLTTIQATFPRFILAEVNTHRVLSRSSASSRAIPIKKRIEEVIKNPFVPEYWGVNQKGMQAERELTEEEIALARQDWFAARNDAVDRARSLLGLGVHKQITNRLLEPYLWHTAIVTATEWANFFALRISPEAQPEFKRIAEMMKAAMDESSPTKLPVGGWHLPLVQPDDWAEACTRDDVTLWTSLSQATLLRLAQISAGRCARVSYLTHASLRDPEEDIKLAKRLMASGHMSPFEHMAQVSRLPLTLQHEFRDEPDCLNCGVFGPLEEHEPCRPRFIGNFRAPWVQYRKMLPNEAVFKRGES